MLCKLTFWYVLLIIHERLEIKRVIMLVDVMLDECFTGFLFDLDCIFEGTHDLTHMPALGRVPYGKIGVGDT